MEDVLQVGAIANTHGVRGEVKVFPMTDDVARFQKLRQVLLDTGNGLQELEITQVKYFKNLVILKFKGIDTIEEIEKYKGKGLFVARENAVKCEKGEYFIADLIGMQVETEEGEKLGELKDVLTTGANDVYVVDRGGRELLLPAIKDCIKDIDMEQRVIRVFLMPGLED